MPNEWNLRDAWIADLEGNRIVDLQESPLHVVGYSMPIRTRISAAELRRHAFTLPEHPDWIPYRTSYYGQTWGFCLTEKELHALSETLPNFRYVPALSEADGSEPWDGEVGLITDVVKKHETDLSGTDSYVCGPPPMVEAAIDVLTVLGAPEKNIYYDKFTTTGSA